MKSPCDIIIVSRDAGPFSECGEKGLFCLLLHGRESA